MWAYNGLLVVCIIINCDHNVWSDLYKFCVEGKIHHAKTPYLCPAKAY